MLQAVISFAAFGMCLLDVIVQWAENRNLTALGIGKQP